MSPTQVDNGYKMLPQVRQRMNLIFLINLFLVMFTNRPVYV